MASVDFALARRSGSHNAAVLSRSRALAAQIERLLRSYGRTIYDREIRALNRRYRDVSKGINRPELEADLFRLLQRFGLAQMSDAGMRAAGAFEIQPQLLREMLAAKEIKVRLIIDETEHATRESLRQILIEAEGEVPRPTQVEVARRIARQWFGPARKTTGDDPYAQERMFSHERAATIARTELAQAENDGIVHGLMAAEVERVEWAAQPDDGRSGKRKHFEMNEHPPIMLEAVVKMDESGWFTLPSGLRAPYPMWSGLPAGEIISCRCFSRAVT